MSPKPTELQLGDPCPVCGGAMHVDPAQDPDALIDRNRRNSHVPAQAARFAQMTREKAEEFGVIYKCDVCGYRARLHDEGDDSSRRGASADASRRTGGAGAAGRTAASARDTAHDDRATGDDREREGDQPDGDATREREGDDTSADADREREGAEPSRRTGSAPDRARRRR